MSLVHGDLFDVLPTLEAESVDACVTDPPYGIGFMGREWDTFKPGVEQKRIVPNRAIDSDNPNLKGRTRGPASSPSAVEYNRSLSGQRQFEDWNERWAREVLRVLKPGGYLLVCGAPRSFHRLTCGVEDADFEIRDCLSWIFGQGFPKSLNVGDGRGTALKPAWEPIIMARKPVKGTVKANVDRFGTGAINVDGCRIGTSKSVPASPSRHADMRTHGKYGPEDGTAGGFDPMLGRWPANVCLDEEAAAMLDDMSGELASGDNPSVRHADKHRNVYAGWKGEQCLVHRKMDSGGASRFFYTAKPSREERDLGCEGLSEQSKGQKWGETFAQGRNPVTGDRTTPIATKALNTHPTVKPLALMRWLVRLVTPPGGLVLDPFTGSGTTGMACAAENLRFLGIEREAEYIEIATRRIASIAPLFSDEATA